MMAPEVESLKDLASPLAECLSAKLADEAVGTTAQEMMRVVPDRSLFEVRQCINGSSLRCSV